MQNNQTLLSKYRWLHTKLPIIDDKIDGMKKEKRQFGETISMESLNSINGIVQQIHWNRWTKSMDLFRKTVRLRNSIWQKNRRKPAVFWVGHDERQESEHSLRFAHLDRWGATENRARCREPHSCDSWFPEKPHLHSVPVIFHPRLLFPAVPSFFSLPKCFPPLPFSPFTSPFLYLHPP